MIGTAAILAPIAVVYLVVRVLGTQETRLRCSIQIKSPANMVFSCISAVDRVPEWYGRSPAWAPGRLKLLTLATWGERTPRQIGFSHGGSNLIEIRSLENRIFYYEHNRLNLLNYRSTFRITSCDRECILTWEICYKFDRWIDTLFSTVTANHTYTEMEKSLERIRCVVEAIPVPDAREKLAPETDWQWSRRISRAS